MSLGLRESVGQGFSDLLPMDLQYPSEAGSRRFVFDWRTHLCTVFSQMCWIDETEQASDVRPVNYLSAPDPLISSLQIHHVPQLASSLLEPRPGLRIHTGSPSPEMTKALIDAANTSHIGMDGRLLYIREMRRKWLGWLSGQLRREEGYSQRDLIKEERYAKRDDWHVARQLLLHQDAAALEGKLWKL